MKLFKIFASILLFASIFSSAPQTSFGMKRVAALCGKCANCLCFWRNRNRVNQAPVAEAHVAQEAIAQGWRLNPVDPHAWAKEPSASARAPEVSGFQGRAAFERAEADLISVLERLGEPANTREHRICMDCFRELHYYMAYGDNARIDSALHELNNLSYGVPTYTLIRNKKHGYHGITAQFMEFESGILSFQIMGEGQSLNVSFNKRTGAIQ